MWVLIVIGIYSGGFGFSQEFISQKHCEYALHTIEQSLKKAPAYAYCIPKGDITQ